MQEMAFPADLLICNRAPPILTKFALVSNTRGCFRIVSPNELHPIRAGFWVHRQMPISNSNFQVGVSLGTMSHIQAANSWGLNWNLT